MDVIRVDSIDDARLAGYARLGEEAWLVERGWFVAEGRFVVERLIAARRQRVLSLLLNEAALAALGPALAGLEAPVFVCAPRFFERLTGHHFHRGCLALAERPALDRGALAADAGPLLVLDRVVDADNVGSVFRSAFAFGVGAIWLGPGCADPLARKATRTSMAATLRVPFARLEPGGVGPSGTRERAVDAEPATGAPSSLRWTDRIGALRDRGFTLIALSPREPARDLADYSAPTDGRLALLVGSEGDGLSAELEAIATLRLRIPMQPGIDSLNLGVAAGIALHWLTRARAAASR